MDIKMRKKCPFCRQGNGYLVLEEGQQGLVLSILCNTCKSESIGVLIPPSVVREAREQWEAGKGVRDAEGCPRCPICHSESIITDDGRNPRAKCTNCGNEGTPTYSIENAKEVGFGSKPVIKIKKV